MKLVFSGLSSLVIEGVEDDAGTIAVRASTRPEPVACPGCAVETGRVHAYVERRLADVPVDARPVVVRVRALRMLCSTVDCARQTFREPVPVAGRYQRRTARLATQVGRVVRELAGRAGARVLAGLGVVLSRHTALRALLRLPVPVRPVPVVIGVDDFALRKRQSDATVIIDAVTGERVDVLADRTADALEAWLREHSEVRVVCRDGSGAYAEAIRRGLPDAVQVADRWHLWHNLAEAVLTEVAAHSACWGTTGPPPREGKRAATTRERWQQVHDLLERGVGLLEIARRVNLALNTVKRDARISQPERLVRAPQYRPTLVDPFRDYLRQPREQDPAVPGTQLLGEITELGYTGSQNLLYRYITQGRVEADRLAISPKRLARYLDRDAVNAALTHPFHNGRTEGVNTKTKLIKRQMYGRAGFTLLRHRILLG